MHRDGLIVTRRCGLRCPNGTVPYGKGLLRYAIGPCRDWWFFPVVTTDLQLAASYNASRCPRNVTYIRQKVRIEWRGMSPPRGWIMYKGVPEFSTKTISQVTVCFVRANKCQSVEACSQCRTFGTCRVPLSYGTASFTLKQITMYLFTPPPSTGHCTLFGVCHAFLQPFCARSCAYKNGPCLVVGCIGGLKLVVSLCPCSARNTDV